jgi:hypothetical protein
MKFREPGPPLTESDLAEFEKKLGLQLPPPVRALYLKTNGGYPSPYIFDEPIYTSISGFIPFDRDEDGDGLNAVRSYTHLVVNQKLVPRHFFPFAYEGGGDYFFVDTTTPNGAVYFYSYDSRPRLRNLKMDFDTFWASLTEDEDADEEDDDEDGESEEQDEEMK